MRYVKARLFLRTLRFFCQFPGIVTLFYGAYRNAIIYAPFLPTTFKWKMIKEKMINFELNRALYKKGRINCTNDLYLIEIKAGDAVSEYKERKKELGSYTLDVGSTGLFIEGQIDARGIEYLYLKIDNMLVRKFKLTQGNVFLVKLNATALATLPVSSELSVEHENGTRLIYKNSDYARFSVPHGSGNLASLLNNGVLLSKKGTMNVESDDSNIKQKEYIDLYLKAKKVFEREVGKDLFLIYGTLLGCIRNGNMIENDDDFDSGFISYKNSADAVKWETIDVLITLLRAGLNITINPIGRMFRIDSDKGVHLDVMAIWFKGDWNVGYGGAGIKSTVDDFLPVTKGFLMDYEVNVPNNPEVFLSGYYGEGWRIPDPGYVSNSKQTGKTFYKSYYKIVITPREYLKLKKTMEIERTQNPGMGELRATAFNND